MNFEDFLVTRVTDGIQSKINTIVREIKDEAVKRIEREIREEVANIALTISKQVDLQRLGDRLVITIYDARKEVK